MFIVDKEAGNRARQQLEALATAIGLECDASLANYVGDGSSLRPFLTVDQARRAQATQPTRAIKVIMYGAGTINPAVQPAPYMPPYNPRGLLPEPAIETAESEALPPVSPTGNGALLKDIAAKLRTPGDAA